MSNEHLSTWSASVYMVHVTVFPRGSACVYTVHVVKTMWYADVAVLQILQYLREFDAPAMQSCKPMACGTGS